jgi:hypothetical protein
MAPGIVSVHVCRPYHTTLSTRTAVQLDGTPYTLLRPMSVPGVV